MSRSADFKHSGKATQVTIRVNEKLRDAYDDAVGDGNRSEAIREHMKEVAGEDLDDDPHPLAGDPELRKAYETLTDLVSEQSGKVDTEVAMSKIADKLNVPKESVRQSIFARLEDKGLIRPAWGQIRVGRL